MSASRFLEGAGGAAPSVVGFGGFVAQKVFKSRCAKVNSRKYPSNYPLFLQI